MGALSFIIYNEECKAYNIEFSNYFLKSKNRGPDNSSYTIEHSQNTSPYKISADTLKMNLSRSELSNYTMHTFIYNHHRLCINDTSIDANQPFEDPIPFKIKDYPELRKRPKRKLLCDGEIYNYSQLKKSEVFSDKDLQSNCDVEIILPLYIKYGIEKTLNMLNGDFSLVLTENTNTFILKSINIFCARDRYGVKPLWYISNKDASFFMFTSDIESIPDFIKTQTQYEIKEVPQGTYWSFQTKQFKTYTDETCLNKTIINKTDPDTLQYIYNNIETLLQNACDIRVHSDDETSQSIGILLDSTNFNSCLITSLLLKSYFTLKSNKSIHLFSFNNENSEFISFLDNKYNHNNKLFHHIIYDNHFNEYNITGIDNNSIKSSKSNIQNNTNNNNTNTNLFHNIYKYIKLHQINIKICYSGYGLNQIWLNKLFNVSKYEYDAGKYGIELRFPYIDIYFINFLSRFDNVLKQERTYKINTNPIDKYIIRKTFEKELPYNITWN